MPRAFVAVTNDLITDNRVHRTCKVLMELGYKVILIGRQLPQSQPIDRPYRTRRMKLFFNKGALFYAEYNLRLFFFLLMSGNAGDNKKGENEKNDLIVANDLDTLLAGFLAAKSRNRDLVYDSHEYFTEVPELAGRSARRIWLAIERWIFPKLRHVITVNESIAAAYHARYPQLEERGVRIHVIRNIPMHRELGPAGTRRELQLPEDKFILILQGSGINVERGGEEAVMAMADLPEAFLLIVGGGDAWPVLRQLVAKQHLEDRVRLLDRMPYVDMMRYTRNADLGLSLDKDTNLNYRFSLPNKLFDYFQAHIPVLATDLPEVAAIVGRYDAGVIIPKADPLTIAEKVKGLIADKERQRTLRQNAIFAANSLDGEREKETLKALFQRLG